jgi:RNA polymerase sigma-70 factor (ECF subfamily)
MSADDVRFTQLWEEHYRPVLAYALRRASGRAEAQDVVSETFLVLWRRLGDAPRDDQVLPWLYGIARRVLSNRQRTRTRQERVASRLREVPHAPSPADDAAGERLEVEAVLRALSSLKESDREIVLLAAWEGLGHREIAIALGCSENAAAVRLHRARQRLVKARLKETASSGHERNESRQERRPEGKRTR